MFVPPGRFSAALKPLSGGMHNPGSPGLGNSRHPAMCYFFPSPSAALIRHLQHEGEESSGNGSSGPGSGGKGPQWSAYLAFIQHFLSTPGRSRQLLGSTGNPRGWEAAAAQAGRAQEGGQSCPETLGKRGIRTGQRWSYSPASPQPSGYTEMLASFSLSFLPQGNPALGNN